MTTDIQKVASRVLRYASRRARETANAARLRGNEVSPWDCGSLFGQLLVAKHDLEADPVEFQAVSNEVRFLSYRYGRS